LFRVRPGSLRGGGEEGGQGDGGGRALELDVEAVTRTEHGQHLFKEWDLLPFPGIEGAEIGQGLVHDVPPAIGRPLQGCIVNDHKCAGYGIDVQLQPPGPHGHGPPEGTEGVFRFVAAGPAMGEDGELLGETLLPVCADAVHYLSPRILQSGRELDKTAGAQRKNLLLFFVFIPVTINNPKQFSHQSNDSRIRTRSSGAVCIGWCPVASSKNGQPSARTRAATPMIPWCWGPAPLLSVQ